MENKPILKGAAPLTGSHCESRTLINAQRYLDYGLEEAGIVGGGAGPAFLVLQEGFLFIGGRKGCAKGLQVLIHALRHAIAPSF